MFFCNRDKSEISTHPRYIHLPHYHPYLPTPITIPITMPPCPLHRYEVCGRVVIDKVPEQFASRTIVDVVTATDNNGVLPPARIRVSPDNGKFCSSLAPGVYTFKVHECDLSSYQPLLHYPCIEKQFLFPFSSNPTLVSHSSTIQM